MKTMLKVGDFIKCRSEEDCKERLFELSLAGYGGVVANVDYTYIRITSVPTHTYSFELMSLGVPHEEIDKFRKERP